MVSFMKQYENQTYALMRIIAGFLFLWHGSQKLLGFPSESMAGGYVSNGAPAVLNLLVGR